MTLRRLRPAVPLVVPTVHGWWLLALALALGVSWRLTDLGLMRSAAVLLACLAAVALFAVMFAKALTDDDPFYRTDNDAHYQRIADLCPNLSGQDQIDCYTWLRKGGHHE